MALRSALWIVQDVVASNVVMQMVMYFLDRQWRPLYYETCVDVLCRFDRWHLLLRWVWYFILSRRQCTLLYRSAWWISQLFVLGGVCGGGLLE